MTKGRTNVPVRPLERSLHGRVPSSIMALVKAGPIAPNTFVAVGLGEAIAFVMASHARSVKATK